MGNRKKKLDKIEESSKIELIYLEEWITKKPYSNIYHYTSKKHHETKDDMYAVAGNAPFLVEKKTGRIVIFGTVYADKYYIKAYENGYYDE